MNKTFSVLALLLGACVMTAGCVAGMESDATIGETSSALTVGSCGSTVAPFVLFASGDHVNQFAGGTLTVTNNTTDLVLTFTADPIMGYKFSEILAYAGTGPIPTDPVGGWQDFTQFPIGQSFDPAVTTQQITIPLASLLIGEAVGQTLNIAAYVVMTKDGSPTVRGWSWGENHTGCGCYGEAFPYTICGGTVPTEGCTFTQGYWKTHHESAKNKSQQIDWPAPMDEKQKLCSSDARTLLTILSTNSSGGNAYQILARQYIAAKLNMASGASSTAEVDAAMALAITLLNQYCGQAVKSNTADGQLMTIAGGILDAYNNGLTGPGHCNE